MKWTVLTAVGLMLAAFVAGVVSLAVGVGGQAHLPADVAERLTYPVLTFLFRVGMAHVVAGLVCGLAAALLARLALPERRVLGPIIVLTLVFGWAFGRDVVMRPVFYEPILYAPGGITRALMVLVTDHLSPQLIDAGGLVALAGLLGLGAWRRRGASRRLGAGAAVGAVAVVGVLLAAGRPAPNRPAGARGESPMNIVFLGMDSLRPDRLQALGASRVVLPNIDRVAENAVVFRNAYVPLARTAPSLASLFTGADPHTHGIRHMFPPAHRRTIRIPTLSRVLGARGYRSEVVTDYAGDMFRLIDLGFDAVHGPAPMNLIQVVQYEIIKHTPAFLPFFNNGVGHRLFPVLPSLPANADPDWLADRVLDRLGALDTGTPFVLTAFFSGPHTPYAAPYPGYRLFADPGYEGPNKYAFFARSLDLLARLEEPLPPAEVAQIRALYDGASQVTDAAVGRVIEAIRARGLWENTLIVLFSDHGESLYEPGNTSDHGKWFRGDEANRIPLVLAGGPVEKMAGVVDGLVRMTDVLPTILGLIGADVPPTVEGVDLGPRLRGQSGPPLALFAETGVWLDAPTTFARDAEALIYPSIDKLLVPDPDGILVLRDRFHEIVEEAKHRCIRTEQWKLVYSPTRTGVRCRLYDVVKDPANLTDVAAEHPWQAWRLRRRLTRWMRRDAGKHFDHRGHLVPAYQYYE